MDYFLLLALTFVMFVRPQDIFPELETIYLYYWTILAALAAAMPKILDRLGAANIARQPVIVCVLGVQVFGMLSHLAPGNFVIYNARVYGFEFLKVFLFFLLVVAVLDTPVRLRHYLNFLMATFAGVILISLGDHLGYYRLETIPHIEQTWQDPVSGAIVTVHRMSGMGVFADPNDISLMITVTMALAARGLFVKRNIVARIASMGLLVLCGFAIMETHSRGGFLMLMAATISLGVSVLGVRRSMPFLVVAVPALFAMFAGRQTSIDLGGDTGQSRLQIWSECLFWFKIKPLWGVGMGNLPEMIQHVAHNSFLHAFTELGIFGGMAFGGIWLISIRTLTQLRPSRTVPMGLDPRLAALQPFLVATAAGYAMGMFSLSRCYVLPTYLIPGVAAAYADLVRRQCGVVPTMPRGGYLQMLLFASIICLLAIQSMIWTNVIRS